MKVNITTNRLLVASFLSVGLMVVLIAVGVVLGSTITQNTIAEHSSIEDSPLKLMADTASAGKNVSLASARVDEELECLYILDHLNGNLQCWLLNIRNGQVGGIFRTNVLEAMPGVKAGRSSARAPFANCKDENNSSLLRRDSSPLPLPRHET